VSQNLNKAQVSSLGDNSRVLIAESRSLQEVQKVLSERTSPDTLTFARHQVNNDSVLYTSVGQRSSIDFWLFQYLTIMLERSAFEMEEELQEKVTNTLI
jgi:hypothetical protein